MDTTTPILMVTFGNLRLSQEAVQSLLPQTDHLHLIDNQSWDSTPAWLLSLDSPKISTSLMRHQVPLAEAWNQGIGYLFALHPGASHVLVANNDILALPNAVELLRSLDHPFVTGVGVFDAGLRDAIRRNLPIHPPNVTSRRPHPDFSFFLIRRDTWNTVGPFDENFRSAFCEDLDYHLRMHRAGIHAECADVPFYHESSASVKSCPEHIKFRILRDAQRNREYFERKWGVPVPNETNQGTGYYSLFGTTPPPEARSYPVASSVSETDSPSET